MARCSEVEQEIQSYIDDEIEKAKALIIEEHISNCVRCRSLFEEYRKVNAVLHEAFYPYRLKESLDGEVMGKIPRRENSYEQAHALTLRVKKYNKPGLLFTRVVPHIAVALIAILGTYIFIKWPSIKEVHQSSIGYAIATEDYAFLTQGEKIQKIGHDKPISLILNSYIETSDKGFCFVGFTDNTMLKLAQNTRIKIIDNRNIELVRGKILCEVSRTPKLFRIRTEQGQITVLGTKFQVELIDGKLTTTVISGEVKVETAQKFAILKTNEELVVQNRTMSDRIRIRDANAKTKWADKVTYLNLFAFRERAKTNINLPVPVSKVYIVPIDHKRVSEVVVEWDKSVPNNSNYTIYMYDEELKPLLRYKISKEIMSQKEGTIVIPMPDDIKYEDMGLIHIEILSDDIDQPNSIPFTRVYAKS